MRRLLPVLLWMAFPAMVFAQLTDDQQALLDEVRESFEKAEAWQSYSQSIQETTTLAYTRSSESWETNVTVREILLEVDETEISGSVDFTQSVLTSDMETMRETTAHTDFEISEEALEAASEVEEVVTQGLPVLVEMDVLLENVTAVYDLGVRDVRGEAVQEYQLEVDLLASLSALNLDMNPLSDQLERGQLLEFIAENGTLSLQVATHFETGQLLSTEVFLDLPIETDDLVLEFSYEIISNYYDVVD
ncbi:MAG: hypothetical protein KJ064_19100 [Anaerolineae bacterium]|nr:hypothetical protein [Anaerolineae bacterium]